MKIKIMLLITLLLYLIVVCGIQRFKNPRLSETELFLLTPENIILKFKL